MNLIVLSHMYPKKYQPYGGIFVEKQVEALRRKLEGNIIVISPVPWSPKFLWFRKKWKGYGQAEREGYIDNIKIYYPRYLVLPGSFFFPFSGFFMYFAVKPIIKELVKTNEGEIILHTHTILPDGFVGALLTKQYHIPVICTVHGDDIKTHPYRTKLTYYLTKYALKNVSKLIAVSGALANEARKIIPNLEIEIIPNGASFDNTNNDLKQMFNDLPYTKKIIFIGDLLEEKGIKELLMAFALIHKKYPNTLLLLVGRPYLKPWITDFVNQNNLANCVVILGIIEHKNILNTIKSADIFVLPSHSEGMPTVMFEAMAAKLPMIISNVGGVPEVIKNGINGLLIRPKSVNDIVEKIDLLLSDDALYKKLAENAYKEFFQNYTWDKIADLLLKVYQMNLKGGV